MNNIVLTKFNKLKKVNDYYLRHVSRDKIIHNYTFAVPDANVINKIKNVGPIIEIGAGTGYWASLIAQAGGDIIAFDKYRVAAKKNHYFFNDAKEYFNIQTLNRITKKQIIENNDFKKRALFLCWPTFNTNMAAFWLNVHRKNGGTLVIYVGESRGGCTADDRFFDLLEKHYEEVEYSRVQNFYGIHDNLYIYKLKGV